MCPACAAAIASIIAGATSAGGLAAMVVKKLNRQADAGEVSKATQSEEENDGGTG